jgi:hypothetical protein
MGENCILVRQRRALVKVTIGNEEKRPAGKQFMPYERRAAKSAMNIEIDGISHWADGTSHAVGYEQGTIRYLQKARQTSPTTANSRPSEGIHQVCRINR